MSLYCIPKQTGEHTTQGEGSTSTDKENSTIDGAIDEAIKAETEKLYEEACSNISSPSGILPF